MVEVSKFRLNLMRAMYALIAFGLAFTVWPEILFPQNTQANSDTVVSSLLGALAVLSLLGLRYPLTMLPLLFFELLWKMIWVGIFAVRMWMDSGLDAYAKDTLFACSIGLVLVPLVIPWSYVVSGVRKFRTVESKGSI